MTDASSATDALLRYAAQTGAEGTMPSFDGASCADNRLDLRGRQMEGVSLRQTDLSHADLGGANLAGAKGGGLVLRHAVIEGTDFTDADLIGADLSASSAGEANFTGALLEDANLHAARLRFANFTGAIMDGADFSKADLWGATLTRAAAERTSFRAARLDEAQLEGADLSESDFTGAALRRANLSAARLRRVTFRDAVLDGAKLAKADLSGAVLTNVSLASCDLTQTRFAGAWLERTRMRAKQLGGAVGEEVDGDLEAALDSYLVLEQNFVSLGSHEDASWAYRRKRRVGRALHWKQSFAGLKSRSWGSVLLPASRWFGDVIAEWLCDYGESLGRVVRAFFMIWICFAITYWLTGSVRPREGFEVTHTSAIVNYLLFSLNSMTTVGTSEVGLRSNGELGTLLSSLQTVIGTILLGLFGFVLGARIRN